MTLRIFAALPAPDPICEAALDLMTGVPDASWRPRENLHITLAFFGALDAQMVEELDSALAQIRCAPFTLQLSGAGHFGGAEPSALWLGVAPSPPLDALAQACVRAGRRLGVAMERRAYLPHLTLAYLRAGVERARVHRFEQRNSLFRSEPFEVDRFHLYSSWPRKPGKPNLYRIETEYPLAG